MSIPRKIFTTWKEKDILAGPLNKEHESFSLTKIIGIKLCEYYNLEYKTNFI